MYIPRRSADRLRLEFKIIEKTVEGMALEVMCVGLIPRCWAHSQALPYNCIRLIPRLHYTVMLGSFPGSATPLCWAHSQAPLHHWVGFITWRQCSSNYILWAAATNGIYLSSSPSSLTLRQRADVPPAAGGEESPAKQGQEGHC